MQPNDKLIRLRDNLVLAFNIHELETLCFDLGVDFDNLIGEGKENKTREIVKYLERIGKLQVLITYCAQKRPHMDWVGDSTSKQIQSTEHVSSHELGETQHLDKDQGRRIDEWGKEASLSNLHPTSLSEHPLSLPHELLLLLLDENTGELHSFPGSSRRVSLPAIEYALCTAIIAQLFLDKRLMIDSDSQSIAILNGTPMPDEMLNLCLRNLNVRVEYAPSDEKPNPLDPKIRDYIYTLKNRLRPSVLALGLSDLAKSGLVTMRPKKNFLGRAKSNQFPITDPLLKQSFLTNYRDTVLTNQDVGERYSIMTALLYGSDCYKIVFAYAIQTEQILNITKRLEAITKSAPIADALMQSVHHLLHYSAPYSSIIGLS